MTRKDQKHYHVLAGIVGCMPSINDPCKTKAEAKECLRFWRDEYREAGVALHGSIQAERFDVVDQPEYIEISECWEADCFQDWTYL